MTTVQPKSDSGNAGAELAQTQEGSRKPLAGSYERVLLQGCFSLVEL